MKFDLVIGNPPYNENDGGGNNGDSAKPLYHLFVNKFKSLNVNYLTLIIPARWYTGGKGLDDFREEMLNSKKISNLIDYPNSTDCFEEVNIAGGICYFLWENKHKDKCKVCTQNISKPIKSYRFLKNSIYPCFIRHTESIKILRKIYNKKSITISSIVTVRNPFDLVAVKSVLDNKTKELAFENSATVYCAKNKVRYILPTDITKNIEIMKRWKVFIAKANGGAGILTTGKQVMISGKPIVGKPLSVCTDSLLSIGSFSTKIEAINLSNYIKTKFFRFLVGNLKTTQLMSKKVYDLIPLQDFTENSDIDWTKSIIEIDQQLYKKYKLDSKEIAFIESMIKPME